MAKKNLSILMLLEYFYPFDKGGAEWSSFYLAKSLVKNKIDVAILTPSYGVSKQLDEKEGVKVFRFPFYKKISPRATLSPIHHSSPIWWLLTAIYLYKAIKMYKPDIIHIQGKYFLPSAILLSKLFCIPTVTTARDYISLCPYALCINKKNKYKSCTISQLINREIPLYISSYVTTKNILKYTYIYLSGIYGWIISKLLAFCLKSSDEIVVISRKMKQVFEVNDIKVNQFIHNSVDITHQKKSSPPTNTITFVGRLTPGKGIIELVDAYTNLKNKVSLPKLIIIGEGPLKTYKKCTDIVYLGRLPHEQTLARLSSSIFTVMPSVWEEPFGRVALESISLGTPVLASNRGALPEIIENNKTGYIIPPTVKGISVGIKKMLKNQQFLKKHLQAVRPKLLHKFFTIPTKKYIDLYQKLT